MEFSENIQVNRSLMEKIYNYPLNFDVIINDFEIEFNYKKLKCFLIYHDGMVNKDYISNFVVNSMQVISKIDDFNSITPIECIKTNLISFCNTVDCVTPDAVCGLINFGGVGIFIDGINTAIAADVKGFPVRSVSKPLTENVIRGPQEGFVESVMLNLAMVRKIMRSEKLVAEKVDVGKVSKTPCTILYLTDLTNEKIVNEVRNRMENIDVDYIFSSGELEQLIEDYNFLPTPQILSTERPDMVATSLSEGYVAVLVEGSPFALILPVNAFKLMQTTEDKYLRFPYSLLLRFIRVVALLIAVLLPAIFVAITNFHNEAIPTGFLFTIASTRDKVPFSNIAELVFLEIAFELIREAIIRVPSPIGPTVGIIGALIVGQAAVEANLVSPLSIIIVAIGGIGSYAIPDYSLSFSFRVLKYLYIALAGTCGFVGVSIGVFLHICILCNANSFGVPFLAPISPLNSAYAIGTVFTRPITKQEVRSSFLQPKKKYKQGKFARAWAIGGKNLI